MCLILSSFVPLLLLFYFLLPFHSSIKLIVTDFTKLVKRIFTKWFRIAMIKCIPINMIRMLECTHTHTHTRKRSKNTILPGDLLVHCLQQVQSDLGIQLHQARHLILAIPLDLLIHWIRLDPALQKLQEVHQHPECQEGFRS